jgi:hypothetical protein
MEVGQGLNWGCSAKGKEINLHFVAHSQKIIRNRDEDGNASFGVFSVRICHLRLVHRKLRKEMRSEMQFTFDLMRVLTPSELHLVITLSCSN